MHTYTQQYCTNLGGLCDSMQLALNDPGSKCTSNADCTEEGKHKTPKKPCCASYSGQFKMFCDNIPAEQMKSIIDSAKSSGSCADTDCYEWKLPARGSASSMQVSTWMLAVVVGLNTLFHFCKQH